METNELIVVITAAGAALSTAIGILWKTVIELTKEQSETNKQLGVLQGKQEGIDQLSKQVLDTVHRATSVKDK